MADGSIKLADFHRMRTEAEKSLSERVYDFLQRSDSAHTARDIAARLMGLDGIRRYVTPELDEATKQVEFVLAVLVLQGRIGKFTKGGALETETFFGKLLEAPPP